MKLFNGAGAFDPNDPVSLVHACLKGNAHAQRALVKSYFGYVKSIVSRYAPRDSYMEEVINDSFLKVFQNLEKYDASQPFRAWLRTITINTAIDHYRKYAKDVQNDPIDHLADPAIGPDVVDQISASEILDMVQQLTPAYRIVFSMYVIDGFTHKEIAQRLGIQEGTSKSNLMDARRKLQAMIMQRNPELYQAYELKPLRRHEE